MTVIDQAVAETAVQWWLELQDKQAEPVRLAAWQSWRAADPSHEAAWQRIETVSGQLAGIPLPLARAALTAGGARKRHGLRVLTALVMAGGTVALARRSPLWEEMSADASTATGEIRIFTLLDGGTVALNTGSAINVRYGADHRVLQLLRGEILVQTAADADGRPFLVQTRDGSARAIGTRFTVRQHQDRAHVGVLEGMVELRPADAPERTRLLRAHQQASFTRGAVASSAELAEGAGAWLDGMLVVSHMRLDAFLEELCRYRRGRLACDPAIAGLQVSGAYPLADTDRVLDALTTSLPVRLHFFTRYWVQLRPREK